MRKTDNIFVGDKVKTKKSFKPLLPNGDRFEPEDELEGIVMMKRGGFIMVDFGEQLPFTHYLEGVLADPTGFGVEYKNLVVVETLEIEDKKERDFVGALREASFIDLRKIPNEIRRVEDSIRSTDGSIKSLLRDVDSYEKRILENNFKLKELEEKKGSVSVDERDLSKYYSKMMRSSSIEDVEIVKEGDTTYIVCTTGDLTYHVSNGRVSDCNVGAFKILLPLSPGGDVLAINYKRQMKRGYYGHPCICESRMCLGSAVGYHIVELRKTGNIAQVFHLLINFLKEPEYGQPHIADLHFKHAQEVTINPSNTMQWFDQSFWRNNEVWDEDRYEREQRGTRDN